MNCSDMYTEAQFKASGMDTEDGNFGYRCRETITLSHRLII